MNIDRKPLLGVIARGASSLAMVVMLAQPASAWAQTTAEADSEAAKTAAGDEIVVTASRIERAGFDQPTPTTVIGEIELREGARPNIQQILNDQPQFRQTVTPQVSNGNTSTGTAPVDLRGLGTARTLTLINGRRFAGDNNLNFVPTSLVKRIEVVTGGASAAWGSGAVAGVVNIILDDDLEGLKLEGSTGISSRGDGERYGIQGGYGTSFADGAGSFILGVEYLDDKGIRDRNSRPNLGSASIVRVNPTSTTDLSTRLTRDVNYGNQASGGLITTGALAGQVFNPDGTLRAFRGGTPLGAGAYPAQMIGGEDGIGLYDTVAVSTPFDRLSTYARVAYEIGEAKLWADVTYGRSTTDGPFVPDFTVAPLTIQASNPFLSSGIRSQLAAAGQTSFTLGRFFDDILFLNFDTERENKEGAIGIDGSFGEGRFKYGAYYSHGEVDSDQKLENSRIAANFTKAINAVSSNGQIVCAVNADAIATNDDPACRPLNPFGSFAASPEAVDYVTGTQQSLSTNKLDSLGAEIQGDLFSITTDPVTLALGVEARWEEQVTRRNADAAAGIFALPVFTSDLSGKFDVKEAFAEVAVPVVDVEESVKVDLNGAARYSDYSNSGGIWSWKLGGTVRLFDSLLLRATRSRDIRSPGIGDLFSVRRINVGPLVDQDSAGRAAVPGYNATPATVTTFSGGNPDLDPEISKTLTIGGTFSPTSVPGLNFSVDYYDIDIGGAIATLSASNLTLACSRGSQAACDRVVRNPTTQTVETVFSNAQNIAKFQTRGLDFELSYLFQLGDVSESLPGSLRLRALATYIDRFIFDTGITRVDSAGDVGDATSNGIPKWRGTLSANYQGDQLGVDMRVRYVGGGQYNHLLATLVNNDVSAKTYVDIGAQYRLTDAISVFGNVNNVFDVAPPVSTTGPVHYDAIGTYFTLGARVRL